MSKKTYFVRAGHEVLDGEGVLRKSGEEFDLDDKDPHVLALTTSGYIGEAIEEETPAAPVEAPAEAPAEEVPTKPAADPKEGGEQDSSQPSQESAPAAETETPVAPAEPTVPPAAEAPEASTTQ